MIVSEIPTHAVDLCEWNEELVISSIMELEVFSSDPWRESTSRCSDRFLDYSMKECNTVLSMNNIVSWLEREEEIEVLRDGFFGALSYKKSREECIGNNQMFRSVLDIS